MLGAQLPGAVGQQRLTGRRKRLESEEVKVVNSLVRRAEAQWAPKTSPSVPDALESLGMIVDPCVHAERL